MLVQVMLQHIFFQSEILCTPVTFINKLEKAIGIFSMVSKEVFNKFSLLSEGLRAHFTFVSMLLCIKTLNTSFKVLSCITLVGGLMSCEMPLLCKTSVAFVTQLRLLTSM